jgi:hypothetical protein
MYFTPGTGNSQGCITRTHNNVTITDIEHIIIYFLQKAEKSDDVDIHLLKYSYCQIMPCLACLAGHIFRLPTTSDYTAEDISNPVKSLFGCADSEKLSSDE